MTSDVEQIRALHLVRSKIRRSEQRIKRVTTIVALLGAGGGGLGQRRAIATELVTRGIFAVVPEDILPHGLSPSLFERRLLSEEDLDLAFVNVESWGSAAEFSEFRTDRRIAHKLRVLVEHRYHPLYGSSKGYLADAYLTHDAVFGHVYMYRQEDSPDEGLPSTRELVLTLSERYRQWKALVKMIIPDKTIYS